MLRNLSNSVWWNLFLITTGAAFFSVGIQGVVVHNDFIVGGIFGASLLVNKYFGLMSPSGWFFLLNLPLFVLGWFFVGKRFFWYSLYGMLLLTLGTQFITIDFNIHEQIYAAIAGGILCGAGTGIILRSLGSGGGLDILAITLYSRYNIGVGKVFFAFNLILFCFAASLYTPDTLIASIILVFITSVSVDHVMSLLNQRKIVYVISENNQQIAKSLRDELGQGATFIKGQGAYSGADKLILMAITNNLQLKKLEGLVFEADENALFIVEDSFNVIGSGFGKRKIY